MKANISIVQLLGFIAFLLVISALYFIYKYYEMMYPDLVPSLFW